MRKRKSTRNSSQNTRATAKPIRPPREYPLAAERIHARTSVVRLAPAMRARNYPGRTKPDVLGRDDARSFAMPPPAPRRPSDAATAQPRAADRRAALRYPSRGGARNAAQKPKAGPKTQKARRGRSPRGPSRRGGRRPVGGRRPIGAYRKAPSASATPCPPAALRCSTLGEGGLNCRVRDGTG